jgi:hypothetical protein
MVPETKTLLPNIKMLLDSSQEMILEIVAKKLALLFFLVPMLILADDDILNGSYYRENILAGNSGLEGGHYRGRDTFSISSAYFEGNSQIRSWRSLDWNC